VKHIVEQVKDINGGVNICPTFVSTMYLAFMIFVISACRVQPVEQAAVTQPASTQPAAQPAIQPAEPALNVDFLEKNAMQHIRLMSFNVGWDSIFLDDDPRNNRWRQDSSGPKFERIMMAVEPDILCLQEISPLRDPQQVGDILDTLLPLENDRRWQTHQGLDNIIASRFNLEEETSRLVQSGNITSFGQAMARVDLPDDRYKRDIYLICAHFKSQGGQANIQARQEHADAVIAEIGDAKTPGGEIDLPFGTPIIVLGDFNVYDTDPAHHLTTLLSGDIENEDKYGRDIKPDWDDTDLADALPHHNGASEDTYTWRDDTQEFNPGTLDRILYTDSIIQVENAFVLNTEIMSQADLEAVGLKAGDVLLDPAKGRYDHLPLAVDISFLDKGP
jgi:endonuclease/exonuclease/phosphatase family metal-dependent hydrolase